MKAHEITTAIEQAKSAINNLAWLNVEQLRFARHIIIDGINELVQEKLAEELAEEAKQDETICVVHDLKEKQEFWEGK